MNYMLLTGFKTVRWPLDTSITNVFNSFASRNGMFVFLFDATIQNNTAYNEQNTTHYIQVSYHKKQKYTINDIFCPGFHFNELDILLDYGYASAIDEYFSLLTRFECAFCNWYDDLNNKQKITNAENALVEYDLCIKDKH